MLTSPSIRRMFSFDKPSGLSEILETASQFATCCMFQPASKFISTEFLLGWNIPVSHKTVHLGMKPTNALCLVLNEYHFFSPGHIDEFISQCQIHNPWIPGNDHPSLPGNNHPSLHASEYLLILAIIIVIFSELLACTKLKSIYLSMITLVYRVMITLVYRVMITLVYRVMITLVYRVMIILVYQVMFTLVYCLIISFRLCLPENSTKANVEKKINDPTLLRCALMSFVGWFHSVRYSLQRKVPWQAVQIFFGNPVLLPA